MNILGIESSCDDTAAAVLTPEGMKSNVIASQVVHRQFGGIVPELASRAHHKSISMTVQEALSLAGLSIEEIDAVAVTQGPGLMGSLLVGVSFAKGLALANELPIVGVNHIDAHMYANFITHQPVYPFVCLIVSGGHTRLVYVSEPFKHQVLGRTRDDAAGEAFDKIGKILGLPYPAGPEIDRLSREGDPQFHRFPRALLNNGFEFSFSGLKTSLLYYVREKGDFFVQENIKNICASVSEAITSVLIYKLERALQSTGAKTMMLAGGVSANSLLRKKAEALRCRSGVDLLIPPLEYCTDNAAMIAMTGALMLKGGEVLKEKELKPFARMSD